MKQYTYVDDLIVESNFYILEVDAKFAVDAYKNRGISLVRYDVDGSQTARVYPQVKKPFVVDC